MIIGKSEKREGIVNETRGDSVHSGKDSDYHGLDISSGVKVQFSPVFDHIFSNPERDHGSSSGAYVEPRTGPQVQVRFRFERVRTISATRVPLFYEIWCQKLRKSDVALLTVVYTTCGNI